MMAIDTARAFILISLIVYFLLLVGASRFIGRAFFRLGHAAIGAIGMRCSCEAAVTYRKN